MMKSKIQIRSYIGSILFELESENNTVKRTLEKAVSGGANLSGAYLRGAYLRGANLRGATLSGATLSGATLSGADLSDANLNGAHLRGADLSDADLNGAHLRGADLNGAHLNGAHLRGAPLNKLPQSWINECSKDILYIFYSLKSELPAFRKKLVLGEIDGTQYEGKCACLVGTFANIEKKDVDKLCSTIPFYTKGTQNPSEQWFLNIKEGDTPENNEFSKHVLTLVDMVLQEEKATLDNNI